MIKKEFYMSRFDGISLYRTFSDANMMILQNETGHIYIEAIDVEDAPYTYTETDIPNEPNEPLPDDEISDSEVLATITGADGAIIH